MKHLYVTSTQDFSGKSAMCIILLEKLLAMGKRPGYMKPISTAPTLLDETPVDEDAYFVRLRFGLETPLEDITPLLFTSAVIDSILHKRARTGLCSKVIDAFQRISKGKDLIVLEGGGNLREGWIVDMAPPQLIPRINAKALVVVPYDSEIQVADDCITAKARLGDALLGVVVNKVVKSKMEYFEGSMRPFLEAQGIKIFGAIPKDNTLTATSIRELVKGLGAEVLCAKDRLDELVENVLIGAMAVESALKYFRRRPNKAVITGGDRPDIQLAALETSTRCLILTGNIRPNPMILGRAEKAGVPLIVTRFDTMTTVNVIEQFFGKTGFHQEKKVKRFMDLVDQFVDIQGILEGIQ